MDFEGKDKEQILKDAGGQGVVYKADNTGGAIDAHEYEKMAINVKCTQDIEKSIGRLAKQLENSSDSSDRLSRRLYYLNWILAGATVIIAICTVISLYTCR